MSISGISSNVVQTASSVSTSAVAPYCCSEPSCPCEGGRAAKAKLESKQLEEGSDKVTISPQALERLASEGTKPVSEPITSQAPAPVFEISASDFPEDNRASNLILPIAAYRESKNANESSTSNRLGQVISTYA